MAPVHSLPHLTIVAYTVELLSLIEAYPEAFLEPTEAPLSQAANTINPPSENTELMSLIAEFPEAFAEPDEPQSAAGTEAHLDHADVQTEKPQTTPQIETPAGYDMALHQTITTFGWGKVDVFLRYGDSGLYSIWLTVGKSGTEVQSFCEAIARLTNRLLALGTPITELVKELRGIRGGDSEGLGPHRFLGLVDLFGKVLQDAPPKLAVSVDTTATTTQADLKAETAMAKAEAPLDERATPLVEDSVSSLSNGHQWVELSDTSAIASICPECGAELQQVNGCSGGACVVCGYSSCS